MDAVNIKVKSTSPIVNRFNNLSMIRIAVSTVATFIIAALVGCHPTSTALIVQSSDSGRPLTATFTRAFWSQDQAGEDQIVLLNDPIDQTLPGSTGEPLLPRDALPIRQLLVIKLQWRSGGSTHVETPASSNAVLNWYVYGGGSASMVHYTGSGYVSIASHAIDADVDIHHASLTLAEKLGELRDPLGPFTIDGSVKAINDAAQLQQVLSDLSTAMSEARQANRPASTEPATRPAIAAVPDHRLAN